MNGRRAKAGLCLALALAVSALAAGGASAATNGTTLFTCSSAAAVKTFSDAHCEAGEGSGFGHVAFAESTAFQTTGGEVLLHTVVSGVEVELKATEALSAGTVENAVAVSGEHFFAGTGVSEYKNVTVVKPAGKGCKVKGGEIKTNKLKATTAGQGMGLTFEPSGGTIFAKFEIEGCAIGVLNGVYEITGSVRGELVGATGIFTRAATTAQKTLKMRGQVAGINTATTVSATATSTPLAPTTVETP